MLGLGACLLLRARGAESWAAFALAAALLHTLNHAVFKALLFLGAGAFERAAGSLELDRLGGLLRRMPWTGGAFLVGAMAIAGLPPLNGFASEWLTLQALLHVPAYGGVGDGIAGAIALAALGGDRGARRLLLRQGRRARAARRAAARGRRRSAARRRGRCGPRVVFLALACVVLGLVAGPALRRARRARALGVGRRRRTAGLHLPGTGSLPTLGIAIVLVGLTGALVLLRGQAQRRARADLGLRPARRAARSTGRAPASPSRCGSCSRPSSAPSGRSPSRSEGGVVQEVAYSGRVPHLIDERVYRPLVRRSLGSGRRTRDGCRAAASARTSPT